MLLGWVVAIVLAVLLGLTLAGRVSLFPDPVTATTESRDTSVITAVTTEEKVVLLTLGIQGLMTENTTSALLGVTIPGSDRSSFIQYSFNARIGIEGEDVTIEETGESEYLIGIPEFVFIGHDDETFDLVAEDNGVLSFVTPEIDSVEMINTILNDGAEDEYVEKNSEVLQEQAMAFYRGIVSSVDPDAVIAFEFLDRAEGLTAGGS